MATTDDSLLEVLQEIRAMSDKFEELRHDVDILKGRPPTPARSSSRESSSSSSSSSSSESEDSDSEQSSSRSRANLTKHRVPAKSRTSRRHSRSRRRSRSRHSSRSRAGNKRSHSQSGEGKQNKQGASRSQSRPPTKRSKKAASWADRMDAGDEPVDYSAPVTWPPDSDEEDNPKLQEVSEETKKVLETSCLSRKSNQARLHVRSPYPLPKVTATRSLTLDNYLKPELSSTVKQEDKELDALAPLSTILEETGEDQESKVYQAAKAAVQLVGNASAKLSHLRRKKVVSGLNSALMPLVEEDKNFSKAPPTLFGTEFAQRSKDHVDQVKAIRGLPKQQQRSMPREPFFRGGPPSSRGGEEEETLATGRGEAVPTDPTTATPVDSSGGTQPASQEGRITRTTNSSCTIEAGY